ncbi:RING-H2 finger protein ATL65 [Olea europaea var. sylvestris]|uniref:RING-H2 finger protein ATL65 n=1 Tax=Olea europaea var. sylvestris TaxID=158386 RepID=UPI000C1CF30B|nr:RING-H2 finger protein ATL65 [Olea europaea var. sylvestris]
MVNRHHILLPPAPVPSPAPTPHERNYGKLAPSHSPSPETLAESSAERSSSPPSKLPVDFSPPLIAMVVIIATAFVIITYSRLLSRHFHQLYRRYQRWRRRRRRYVPSTSAGDIESPTYSFDPIDSAFHVLSPYGLDESIIKTIPLSVYTRKRGIHDCAVCLLEFEENDYIRTLPVCSHAFHVDCIDIWLRSHANCPLCRAGIFRPESPFTPLMAARIRPSLEDMIVESTILALLTEIPLEPDSTSVGEITQERSPRRNNQSEERFNGRDFLLKRSYSFGFERNLGSERLFLEPATTSPWRYRRGGGGNFWNKRPSPFTSLTKPRVFSFRYYRGMKSPFSRRRSGGFFPLSESSVRLGLSGGGGSSSRRSKSFASPMFMRSSATAAGHFSSSRLRSGDPEALLSPERFNRR